MFTGLSLQLSRRLERVGWESMCPQRSNKPRHPLLVARQLPTMLTQHCFWEPLGVAAEPACLGFTHSCSQWLAESPLPALSVPRDFLVLAKLRWKVRSAPRPGLGLRGASSKAGTPEPAPCPFSCCTSLSSPLSCSQPPWPFHRDPLTSPV